MSIANLLEPPASKSPSRLAAKRKIGAGGRIRVLVVDDSVVIRQLVTHALKGDPMIEVVASAANGAIALQRIAQLKPDAVTLDVEMPEMDGLETLRRLRKTDANLPVIMFSTLTDRGARITMEALALGANDYVAKASNCGSLEESMTRLRAELVPKIRQFFLEEPRPAAAMGGARTPGGGTGTRTASVSPWAPRTGGRAAMGKPKVVLIAISTGGPNTLATIMPMFPADFPLPIAIVQHMPPVFTRLLAERLGQVSKLKVEEAVPGMALKPGTVLMAPGDYHLRFSLAGTGVVADLAQTPPVNSCRPAADVMFQSAAETYKGGIIGVVLTGMGQDGLHGVEAIRAAGAYVIAQDEASSVVWGMPGFVAKAGLADEVLDIGQVVPAILKQAWR